MTQNTMDTQGRMEQLKQSIYNEIFPMPVKLIDDEKLVNENDEC